MEEIKLTNKEKRDLVKNDYNAIAEVFTDFYSDMEYCKEFINEFIKDLGGKDILEVGCGAGQITNYFYEKGFNVIGLDFSSELLRIAKNKFKHIEFIEADILEYNTTKKFDGIFTKDTLYHMCNEDIIKTLNVFYSLLKEDGKVCISLELSNSLGEQIFVEELDDSQKIYYNYLSEEKIIELLNQAGFNVDYKKILNDTGFAGENAYG
ncbi:MAG: class I SAM-dependent methyltransferase, partial [Clostridia bacterium]|nr:class I SAM-dependent methyltransferase [Clostridia bacterium]